MATSEPGAEAPPDDAVVIEMSGSGEVPRYEPDAIEVSTRRVVLFLRNIAIAPGPPPLGPPHNVTVGLELGEPLAQSDTIQPGRTAVFTIEDLEPGAYVFWCTTNSGHGPHYKLGMVGRLVVTP